MTELSSLQLENMATAVVLANTPSYVVTALLKSGYPQKLAATMSTEDLLSVFASAAARSNFDQYDDIAMLVVAISLALKGEFQSLKSLPEPLTRPRFFAEVKQILPQIFQTTNTQRPDVTPQRPKRAPDVTTERYQRLNFGEFA